MLIFNTILFFVNFILYKIKVFIRVLKSTVIPWKVKSPLAQPKYNTLYLKLMPRIAIRVTPLQSPLAVDLVSHQRSSVHTPSPKKFRRNTKFQNSPLPIPPHYK